MKTKAIVLALCAALSLLITVSAHQDTMMKKQEPTMKSVPMMKKEPMMKKDIMMKKTTTSKKKRSFAKRTAKRKIYRKSRSTK